MHPYDEKKPAGLGRYIFDLAKSLIENDKENEYFIYLKKKPSKFPELSGNNWKIIVLGWGRLWMEFGLFFAPKSDIYLFNTPVTPFFFRPKKTVVVALDFAYKYLKAKNFKERLFNKFLFYINKVSLKRASVIVAISEQTKSDVLKFFKETDKKIKVIYPGFKKICSLPACEVSLPERFFLYVGVIKERKNLLNIVKGFRRFKLSDKTDCKLVVAGNGFGEYYKKIKEFIKKEKIEGEVIFLGFVNDNELSFVYKKAFALVFPSLIEGFGFPILEAMHCGLPVITSKNGSLSEVTGDVGALVDPLELMDISVAMDKIVSNEMLRRELAEKGILRIQKFSWEKTAGEFIKIFKTL